MTEVTDIETASPKPAPPFRKRRPESEDPDRFLRTAKQVVVANYNKYRDTAKSPELPDNGVYIVWFSKTLGNWKAIVASPIIRGLLWEVTCNGHRGEIYIDIYKKINNVKVLLGDNDERQA
jgi:hypothetical protein